MSRIHYGRYFSERYDLGVVYPLDRQEYYRDIFDWVYEDDIESEGIIIVSHRVTGSVRYVVVSTFSVYRALILDTGEILESSSLKPVYRRALSLVKNLVRDNPEIVSTKVLFERGEYSDYEYLNSSGYMQRDLLNREPIASINITAAGYDVIRG